MLLLGGYNQPKQQGDILAYSLDNVRDYFNSDKQKKCSFTFRQELKRDDDELTISKQTYHKHMFAVNSIIQLSKYRLATASMDMRLINIWSTKSSKSSNMHEYSHLQTLEKHLAHVTGLVNLSQQAFKESGEEEDENDSEISFASCSYDKTIIIWSTSSENDQEFQHIQVIKEHTSPILSMIYMQETGELVTGSYDGVIHVWSYKYNQNYDREYHLKQQIKTNGSGGGGGGSEVLALCEIKVDNNSKKNRQRRRLSRSRRLSRARTDIEFASGHGNGSIQIWRKNLEECQAKETYFKRQTIEKCHSYWICGLVYVNKLLISASNSDNRINVFYRDDNTSEDDDTSNEDTNENEVNLVDTVEDENEEFKLKQSLRHDDVQCLALVNGGASASSLVGNVTKNVLFVSGSFYGRNIKLWSLNVSSSERLITLLYRFLAAYDVDVSHV